MHLAKDLFVAENVSDLETVVYTLRRNIPMPRLYCVLFNSEKNRYELISSWELCRGRFPSTNGVVVGVAMGKQETYDLVAYMIEEILSEGKDLLNPRTWIEGVTDEVDV